MQNSRKRKRFEVFDMQRIEQQRIKDEEMKVPGGQTPGLDTSKFKDITLQTRKTSKKQAAA